MQEKHTLPFFLCHWMIFEFLSVLVYWVKSFLGTEISSQLDKHFVFFLFKFSLSKKTKFLVLPVLLWNLAEFDAFWKVRIWSGISLRVAWARRNCQRHHEKQKIAQCLELLGLNNSLSESNASISLFSRCSKNKKIIVLNGFCCSMWSLHRQFPQWQLQVVYLVLPQFLQHQNESLKKKPKQDLATKTLPHTPKQHENKKQTNPASWLRNRQWPHQWESTEQSTAKIKHSEFFGNLNSSFVFGMFSVCLTFWDSLLGQLLAIAATWWIIGWKCVGLPGFFGFVCCFFVTEWFLANPGLLVTNNANENPFDWQFYWFDWVTTTALVRQIGDKPQSHQAECPSAPSSPLIIFK